jgi:hypothetical protein
MCIKSAQDNTICHYESEAKNNATDGTLRTARLSLPGQYI